MIKSSSQISRFITEAIKSKKLKFKKKPKSKSKSNKESKKPSAKVAKEPQGLDRSSLPPKEIDVLNLHKVEISGYNGEAQDFTSSIAAGGVANKARSKKMKESFGSSSTDLSQVAKMILLGEAALNPAVQSLENIVKSLDRIDGLIHRLALSKDAPNLRHINLDKINKNFVSTISALTVVVELLDQEVLSNVKENLAKIKRNEDQFNDIQEIVDRIEGLIDRSIGFRNIKVEKELKQADLLLSEVAELVEN